MSARDLAIGLLFGDGGGGNQSEFFHQLLDESVLVYSHDIDSMYSFDAKVWFCGGQEQVIPKYYSTRAQSITVAKGTTNPTNISDTGQVICLQSGTAELARGIVVVKKNGNPIYAVMGGSSLSWGYNIGAVTQYMIEYDHASGRQPDRKTESVFFYNNIPAEITSTSTTGTADPVPVTASSTVVFAGGSETITTVTGQYSGGNSFTFNYNDSRGGTLNGPTYDPELDKNKYELEIYHEQRTGTINMGTVPVLPIGNVSGFYCDMPISEIAVEMQNVLNAIRTEAGLTNWTPMTLEEGDIVYYPYDEE